MSTTPCLRQQRSIEEVFLAFLKQVFTATSTLEIRLAANDAYNDYLNLDPEVQT